jgi:hypothetical protein
MKKRDVNCPGKKLVGGISLGPKNQKCGVKCEKEVGWLQNIKCHEVGC